jgi:diguanylate cyclase (GGDEF)-like protein
MADALPALAALPAPLLGLEGDLVVAVNPAAERELDRPVSALLGSGFVESLRPESAAVVLELLADRDPSRVTVRRPGQALGDQFFDLRLSAVDGVVRTVAVTDVTELHRLDAAVAGLGNATVALDATAEMVWRPFGNERRFGVADDQALGARTMGWIHPDDLPHMLETFARLLEAPGNRSTELVRMRHPYIEDGWLLSRIKGVNLLDDPAMGAIVVRTEDAAPVDLVEDLSNTTGQFRSLSEAAPVGIVITDRAGTVLYRNELANKLLDLAEGTITADWLSRLRSDSADELVAMFAGAIEHSRHGTLVLAVDPDDAAPTWLRVDMVPQSDEQDRTFGVLATILDVTSETEARRQLAEAQDRLWHLATHDPLTGLPNRVLFLEEVEGALGPLASAGPRVALLYCDLDGFKPVNDRHGHAVGDAVLRIVAERMANLVRDTDVVCRFGGDEFLVLCIGFDGEDEVRSLAERLARAVAEPIKVGDDVVQVGMTVGVAHASAGTLVDDLITDADDAMYAAKNRGTRHEDAGG